jgi:hypothetical protein
MTVINRAMGLKFTPMKFTFIGLFISIIVVVVSIGAVSRQPIEPLLSASDFLPNGFLKYDVKSWVAPLNSIVLDKGSFFVNYRKTDGRWHPFAGRLESRPFDPAMYMVIPVSGLKYQNRHAQSFPGQFSSSDASVHIRCLESGETINLLSAPSNGWTEKAVWGASLWCASKIQIIAESYSDDVTVGVGTPFKIGLGYALLLGPIGYIAAFVLSIGALGLIFIPFLLFGGDVRYRFTSALVVLSGYGYLIFAATGKGLGHEWLMLIAVCAALVPVAWLLRQKTYDFASALTWLQAQICCAGIVILIICSSDPGNGSWLPNYIFYPAIWSTDNHLPAMMARYVFETGKLQPLSMGAWSITDRGFVPAGIVEYLYLLLSVIGIYKGDPIIYKIVFSFQCLLQASIVSFAMLYWRQNGWSRRDIYFFALMLIISPVVLFNSIYVWPKLSSGLLEYLSLLLFLNGLRKRKAGYLALSVAAACASVLHHASALIMAPLFVLTGIAVALEKDRPLSIWKTIRTDEVLIIAGSLIISGSLIIFHDSFGHKTSYGTTFLLTGNGIFGLDTVGIFDVVWKYWDNMDIYKFISLKGQQLSSLIWVTHPFAEGHCVGSNLIGCMRVVEFFCLVPALGAACVFGLAYQARAYDFGRDDLLIALMCVIGLAAFVLVFSAPIFTHHIPFVIVAALLLSGMAGLRSMPRPLLAFIGVVQISNFLIIWFVSPALFWALHR